MASEPIGERIRNLRIDKRLRQHELAKAAHLHPSSLSQIEKGRRAPDTTTLERIAKALGKSVSALMEGAALKTPGDGMEKNPRAELSQPQPLELAAIREVVSAAVNAALLDFAATFAAALGDWHTAHAAREAGQPQTGASRIPSGRR